MPYVEVWVDDPECGGECAENQQLKLRRDFAFSLLLDGKVNEAMDALTKGELPHGWRVDKKLQAKYRAWSEGSLPGFEGPNVKIRTMKGTSK